MKVTIDRGLCNANLAFCQRCSAAFIRHPYGVDRPCIREISDYRTDRLTLEIWTDGRTLEVELNEEMRDLAGLEGWEVLADFDPVLFRSGARRRWHELGLRPTAHLSS